MAEQSTASSSSPSSSNEIEIIIRAPSDTKLNVSIDPSKTVAELKDIIASKCDIEKDRQRLIYSGKVLKDEEKVEVYKIKPGNTVHLVKGASKAAPPPSAAQVPQNIQTGQQIANNPLAPLMNATNPGIGNFNPFAQMGMNTNDPNMMQNYMNTPEAQEQLRNVLNNPAVIDQIIDSSPELRAMGPQARQIMQSEHFRNMMADPNAMRQAMQQAEQMRNMFGGGGGTGFPGAPGGMGGAGGFDPWGAAIGGGGAGTQQAGQQQQQPRGPTNLFNQQPQQGTGAGAGAGAGGAPGAGGMPDFGALQQMLGGMGGMGGMGAFGGAGLGGAGSPPPQAAPQDTRPPEERFSTQLQQLQEMGFVNPTANIRALQASGGNVQAAIEYILAQQSW